jgi:hypothetical protein
MGQKRRDVPVMSKVALPGAGEQELPSRGRHFFQQDDAPASSRGPDRAEEPGGSASGDDQIGGFRPGRARAEFAVFAHQTISDAVSLLSPVGSIESVWMSPSYHDCGDSCDRRLKNPLVFLRFAFFKIDPNDRHPTGVP